MARVTVEDCIKVVKNRFELVVFASRRARDIASGGDINIDRNDDKDAVVALREIAEKKVRIEDLKEEIITSYQDSTTYNIHDEAEVSNDVKAVIKAESIIPGDDEGEAGTADGSAAEKPMFADDNVEVND